MKGFQDKMYNYEIEIPKDAWKKISNALNESEKPIEFDSKIYNIEIAPPNSAWRKINKSLDLKNNFVVNRQRKISLRIRYAAAATIIGLVAFGTIKWLSKGSEDKLSKIENNLPAKNSIISLNTQTSSKSNSNNVIKKLSGNDIALENGKHNLIKSFSPDRKKIRKTVNRPVDLINASSENTLTKLRHSKSSQFSFANYKINNSSADRYITLMTPEGKVIRMSQKWGDLVCTVSGEDQNMECKNQLEKWRERLVCSPLAPSPGNFLDIISMVNSLKENNP